MYKHTAPKFAAACLATAIAGTGITIATTQLAYAAPPAAVVERAEAPARTPADDDARRYAERERTSDKQQAYQGGDYLVIGLSTTAAIVLVVLLLLLL